MKTASLRDRCWMRKCLLLVAIVAGMCAAIGPREAKAAIGVDSFQFSVLNADGSPSTQAGGHPSRVVTYFKFASHTNVGGEILPVQSARDLEVDLPVGMVGNPTAVPSCGEKELETAPVVTCPAASQVGIIGLVVGSGLEFQFPLYNMRRPPGVTAEFGFNIIGVAVHLTAGVRTGDDYGVSVSVNDLPQSLPWVATKVTFWGVPADPSHDEERGACLSPFGPTGGSCPSQAARLPFLTNPSICSPTLTATARVDSWEESGSFARESASNPGAGGEPAPIEGCQNLRFRPTLEVAPESRRSSGPTGLAVRLGVKQNENPDGAAEATLDRAVVTLPKGVSISPSSADGLGACSADEIGLTSAAEPTCPANSQIGTVKIDTPLLDDPLEGALYLAEEGNNPFGSKFAMYMVASGSGTLIKVAGKIELDPVTGQITTTFDGNPQLPFEMLELKFHGGPRAALSAPSTCGAYEATGQLTAWGAVGPTPVSSRFQIDQGCEDSRMFSPALKAGTQNPVGGGYSPFTLQVTAPEGQQNLSTIDASLPPGLLAKLAGVAVCPDSAAASGGCPSASQVGVTTVATGPGTNPIYVPQPGKESTAVYLGGPYKGAPYSLIVRVPAQAGPFNLGTVAVRNALYVDPVTTQVTTKSDPLPQILDGVPIAYRDVRVEINRSEFTLNPTNCDAMQVGSTLTSVARTVASPSVRFQAANCASLGFKPTLALRMRGQTKRAGNPALTATLQAPPGQANIASTTVILPKTAFIDQRHVNSPCTMAQFNANACPAKSILGTAVAYSPLLDKPLEGPVYFRSNGGARKLPDIVADLNGQIHVILVGFIDSKKVGKETSLVRTRFASVPDAPVSKFVLKLKGGKRSLIQNSANICKVRPKAEVKMTGQNGKTNDFHQKIAVKCGHKKKHKNHTKAK